MEIANVFNTTSQLDLAWSWLSTLYTMKYTHRAFSISFRLTSLALGQYDCPSASEATLKNMGNQITWIYMELLYKQNKTKHRKLKSYLMGYTVYNQWDILLGEAKCCGINCRSFIWKLPMYSIPHPCHTSLLDLTLGLLTRVYPKKYAQDFVVFCSGYINKFWN